LSAFQRMAVGNMTGNYPSARESDYFSRTF